MARIAFAWELGAGMGHVTACATLAQALHSQGHQLALVVRELRQLASLPETRSFDVLQAPRCRREGIATEVPWSYSDILLGTGYADPGELAGLLCAWRTVLSGWKADVLIAEHAPTALLAARILGMPRATYGNGFNTPPRLDPLPPFRFDAPVDAAKLALTDRRVLANVNEALARIGAAPLDRLSSLFETDEDFLCTFPELDHYGTRPASGYWGPRLRTDRGNTVDWPQGPGKRIFVYVRDELPQLDALIDHLVSTPHAVVAYVPTLRAARRTRLAGRRRVVSERLMRIDGLLAGCDLVVSHGGDIGPGTVARGIPQLVFPSHYEQYVTARRIEQIGAGLWIGLDGAGATVGAAVETLLSQPRFALAARAFAQRYAGYSPVEQRRRIVGRVNELVRR